MSGRVRLRPTAPVALLLLLGAIASPALAAPGDGPYTPFPEEDPVGRALDFVDRLNRRSGAPRDLTPEELARGVVLAPRPDGRGTGRVVSGPKAPGAATPFKQAGVAQAGDPPSPVAWPFAVVAGILAAGGLLVAARGSTGRARQRGRAPL
jgi:hypothetical protein